LAQPIAHASGEPPHATSTRPAPATRPTSAKGRVKGPFGGFALLFESFGILFRKRSLWGLAAIPMLFSGVAVLGSAGLIFEFAGPVMEFLTGWMPELEVGAWYTWIWLGPAKLVLAILGTLLFAIFSGLSLLLAFLFANVVSAPFLDALSKRVESIETGGVYDPGDTGWSAIVGEARRTMANELQRLIFFVGVWLVIVLGGIVIPGGQLVAPPLLLAFTAIFLPLDYAGYALDRRQISFASRRRWVSSNLPTMAGFGAAAVATSLIPGLNFLLLPTLVVAGTLLALRCPIDSDRTG
jgi:uncharacterized protein involved in cysteine biosynthesis